MVAHPSLARSVGPILCILVAGLGSACRAVSPTALQASPQASPQAERAPNIVLVFVDDLGAGEVGCYGQDKIRTPNIDALAARGVRFTQGYSGSPVCAPSRCVLLTGKHSGHAEVRGNWENGGWGEDQPEGQWPLSAEEITLAERLQASGYRTAGFGKWGLGGPNTSGSPERQGFDHFYGYLCQRKAHNYYPTHLWRNGERAPIEGNEFYRAHQKLEAPLASDDEYYARFGGELEGYAPALMADDMIDWLDRNAGGPDPVFLYYASIIPHLALQVPRDRVEAYPAEWEDGPYLGDNAYLPHASPRRGYAAMITYMDEQVGRIMAALEAKGDLDNTVVIFTSDNGASYVGGMDAAFFNSHDGRRGQKGKLYEGGIRVPFIVATPGNPRPGSVSDHVVSTVDLTATILDLLGEKQPEGLDSVSFAPVLEGRPMAERPYQYWEFRPAGAQAVREGPWKLVRTGLKKDAPKLALYNLGTDPGESLDVQGQHPEIVARLEMLMDLSHEPSDAFPLPTIDGPAKEVLARKAKP